MDKAKANMGLFTTICCGVILIGALMLIPFIPSTVSIYPTGDTPITVIVKELDGKVAWRGFTNNGDKPILMMLPPGKYTINIRWPGHGETRDLTVRAGDGPIVESFHHETENNRSN